MDRIFGTYQFMERINLWKILVDLGEIFDLAHKYFKTKFTVNE